MAISVLWQCSVLITHRQIWPLITWCVSCAVNSFASFAMVQIKTQPLYSINIFSSLFYIFSIFDINCLSIYKALSLVIFQRGLKMLCVLCRSSGSKMLMYKLNWKACYLILCCHLSLNYTACCISSQCKVLHRPAPPPHKYILSNSCQARDLHWAAIRASLPATILLWKRCSP